MRLYYMAILTMLIGFSTTAQAREQIRAVGSSTVYPFVTIVAEEFGRGSTFKTPIIESTGTGGGFKLFCSGAGEGFPDLANASRAIKQSEIDQCNQHGVKHIIELKIGYDGIVLANLASSPTFSLTRRQLFLALAKQVPVDGTLRDNPYTKWSELGADLPDRTIEVYGPPPTSGTRDAFVELVMETQCKNDPVFKAAYPDSKHRKHVCHEIREDGHFIDAGENDNLIVQKLVANPNALGLFGFSFLDQNMDKIHASLIDGAEANFDNIASGNYPISRPLYVYIKGEHFGIVSGLKEFAQELASEDAIGEEGYLTFKGLIPQSQAELENTQTIIENGF